MSSINNILTNKYVISILGSLICLITTYLYDKFEKKEYSYAVYFKIMILGYLASISTILASSFLSSTTNPVSVTNEIVKDTVEAATTTAQVATAASQNIPLNQLKFKIGTPTF